MFLPLENIFHMHLVHTSFHVAIESQDFWFAQLSLHDSEVPNLYNGDYKTQFKECYQFGDSKILKTYQQRKLLGDWYGEREKWKCAFRASEHEYRAAAFHRVCDPLGPTLSIIRCTNGYVFGGYTSLSWAAVSWSQDPKAFCKYQVAARHDPFSLTPAIVFSIVNPTNKPAKLVLGNANDTYAMGGNSAYGPIFGAGNDLGKIRTQFESRVY